MSRSEDASRRRGVDVATIAGTLGLLAVAIGYLLEAIRQRGGCDTGDATPDTLVLSVVLILIVGGVAGIVGVVAALVRQRRRPGSHGATGLLLSLASIGGALSLLATGGHDPGTWFQYCGT